MNLQPQNLENQLVELRPLLPSDFELLYAVASDPFIWEQHPTKERYQKPIFQIFFDGALEMEGAFVVVDKQTKNIIGSSRFYEYNVRKKSITIGYTFYGRAYWGKSYNIEVKKLMINYAFQYVDNVVFHIGSQNIRSQKAIEKLGAVKYDEQTIYYKGEPTANLNFFYKIKKENWQIETKI